MLVGIISLFNLYAMNEYETREFWSDGNRYLVEFVDHTDYKRLFERGMITSAGRYVLAFAPQDKATIPPTTPDDREKLNSL